MEIFGIGLGEMMLIALVALIVLGPDRLPEVARSLGRGVAEIRRAAEPARNAWTDLTSEINKVAAPPGTEKRGNPWEVHPIMEKMTLEERERFMSKGELPPGVMEEFAHVTTTPVANMGSGDGEVAVLDYPMPHSEASFQSSVKRGFTVEDLDYPSPGSTNGHTEPRKG
jgi:Tat protein translocase TatB subunit